VRDVLFVGGDRSGMERTRTPSERDAGGGTVVVADGSPESVLLVIERTSTESCYTWTMQEGRLVRKDTIHMAQMISERWLILPGTAQAEALLCGHEWRDLEEGEDDGIGFLALVGARLAAVRPCKHCVAALVIAESPEGAHYSGALLRDAEERVVTA
jgi:hypothetical protein